MAGLINIGLTGILGHQSALNTTGNNITNANTPGYSRQQTVFESQTGITTGAGTIGSGVSVSEIRRITDQFVVNQLRSDTSLFSEQDTLNTELTRLDNLLGGESTGLNNALNNFFSSIQSAAEDPAALPQRQMVLSEAKGLVNRFQSLHSEFIQQRQSVTGQMQAATSDVNSLLSSIAELNLAISESPGIAQGNMPNDLMDKRDEKIRELSKLIQVKVTEVDGNQVNVSLSGGQALVVGGQASQLLTETSAADPTKLDFKLKTGNRISGVTDQIIGGALGGLRTFQNKVLEPAFDQLGRIALAVSDKVNKQHSIGMDLEGDLGGLFFTDINTRAAQLDRVTGNENNVPPNDGVISVEITNTTDLQARSYNLRFTGANGENFDLIDAETGEIVRQGQLPDPLPAEIEMPGFNVHIESGSFQDGDSFLVRPTRNAAANMDLQINREEDLAFATPIQAEADMGNTGNGSISQGTMLSTRNPLTNVPLDEFSQRGQLSPPLMVRFTSGSAYEILDASDPTNPVALTPPVTGTFQPGVSNKLFSEDPSDPNYRGFQFEISGNPEANDVFMISYNSDGVSDNRNATLLGGLGTVNTMNGGNQSFSEAYAGLVETVGVTTRQSQLDRDAGQALLEQSTNQWESVSGVNLDEEAGRLIQYQAAYNASAKVMSVAQDLFDTLLGTFN
ncbi:flagellar hook-associated protein FlgK [Marinobacter nanhaiticus D15-8W]|uniref:Flagellar hook-associated protein 1 n=1 Tax=Marinobacter nanhaiticus D15-8W TaxID=626887 RepID=N6WYC6_9GAMM|nr:flagellar hook-associated protein FlgK [Marinobacter nanhaiticus]ENO13788.1 flagellar hook-associated protein FlgK [Marinobacter nanhaiticus D15-8W]BES71161.1 flagellar hook-associated protein FlgK [Marinobacter nanhaiticus D15-8W]